MPHMHFQACNTIYLFWFYFMVVQWLSQVLLFVAPQTAARQSSLYFTISQSLLKLVSIELVMLSNQLILYCPLLLLPSVFPSIGVFSSEPALRLVLFYSSPKLSYKLETNLFTKYQKTQLSVTQTMDQLTSQGINGGKHFRFLGSYGLCCNYLTLFLQRKRSHRQYINKWVQLCSNKTLFINTSGWGKICLPTPGLYNTNFLSSHLVRILEGDVGIPIILLAFFKQIKAKVIPQNHPPTHTQVDFPFCLTGQNWVTRALLASRESGFKGIWESSIYHRGIGFIINLG